MRAALPPMAPGRDRDGRSGRSGESTGVLLFSAVALIAVIVGASAPVGAAPLVHAAPPVHTAPPVHAATPVHAAPPDLAHRSHPDTLFVAAPGPRHRMARLDWDIGTGFLRVRPDPDGPPGAIPSMTVDVRAVPDTAAPIVARVRFDPWELRVESTEMGLTDGGLEVGYEEIALPVMEVRRDDDWVRASYGFAADGSSRTGWVDVRRSALEVHDWGEWLSEWGVLFFIDPETLRFHDAPGGPPIRIDLVPDPGRPPFDYMLYALRTDGPWMDVEVASPSDYCVVDHDPESLRSRAWIRHLDDHGRPLVWYFTRGCE